MTRFLITLALFVSLAAAGLAEIAVSIAPDQPIPHVYIDDVLVLELRSDQDVDALVRVTIRDHTGAEETGLDATLPLKARGIRWVPLEGVAQRRGRYVARVTIEAAGDTYESNHPFCRVDRPASMLAPPVGAMVDTSEPYALLAMRNLPLGKVCFSASNPELDSLVEAANRVGLDAAIILDLAETPPELAVTLPEKYGPRVAHWGIEPGEAFEAFETVAAAFVDRDPLVPFSLIADTPEALGALLNAGAGGPASAITLRSDAPSAEEVAAFERVAQTAGYERLPLHVFGRGIAEDGPEAAARLIRNLIVLATCGVVQVDIDGALLFYDQEVTEAYVFLSALARRLAGAAPIGTLDAPAPLRALVFRVNNAWLVTAWSEGEDGDLEIPTGDATILEFADASNNPLPPPKVTDGVVSLSLTSNPVYLLGEGGDIMATTARRMMQITAEAFAANEDYAALLPEQVMEIFEIMRKAEPPRIERAQFLALLPMFPLLEAKWHSGLVAQDVAVPAMRSLSELIRHAAVIEQASGEPFVQPLPDTLATCAEFQQDFLTRAETPPETRQRADWLLAEVTRLVTEAKELDKTGRTIEANAVASLAKWRARSLNATLTQPESPKPSPEEEGDEKDSPDEEADESEEQ
ncbi:MAG: hypothetical protein R6V12_02520 [Candidatus Hydrogenedentota bacterium]